ncbi:MAG: hypothetical protein J6M15_10845 [Prevotella sp.]|nr:hypothetical protein [Prevotella sp.]
MKKMKRFAYVGAIALLSVLGFSACSSNDDALVDNNPTYNPQTGEVNVNFVFNVSTSNGMRMSAANTQATESSAFRGITNAHLGTFTLNGDNRYLYSSDDEAKAADKLHYLNTVIGNGKLNPNATETDVANDITKSRRVLQLSLASGTNTLLFWGKAIKDGDDAAQGRITMNIAEKPSETTFSMCKIVPDDAYAEAPGIYKTKFVQYQNLIANVLNIIVNSGIKDKPVTFGTTAKTVTLNWKDYVTVSGEPGSYVLKIPTMSPVDNTKELTLLDERLATSFKSLNTIHVNELRAGYGLAISEMMKDLMGNINQVVEATPLNFEEAVTIEVANAIKENVEKFFNKASYNYVWNDTEDVKTASSLVTEKKELIDDNSDLMEFPSDFKLPLGSVILRLDITADGASYKYTYSYANNVETYAMGGSTTAETAFNPDNYMFPAELCYFGNSPIRVTNQDKVANDYPDGASNWDNDAWTGWSDGHVTSSTRSVAMRHNINYGTALLKSTVRYGADKLSDHNNALQAQWNPGTNEPDNVIDVTGRNDAFVLTGVLVGGQNPEVGWNYIAKTNATGFGSMVYDKVPSGSGVIPGAIGADGGDASQPVFTLLWDNWDNALKDNKQRDVYVALEFVNKSSNFFGENNLIRNNTTFYLIGKLDPNQMPKGFSGYTQEQYNSDLSLGITWPEKYALPPYDTDGNTIKQRRVFMQDYVTEASFVIGAESLKHALVSVPDLRSGQIALGLSVDLNWRTGINFGDVVLGQ